MFLRNSITISLIVSVPLQLHWSLKNAIMYICRDLWPTCRCIQLVRTFVWTLLPLASLYMCPFDWIESIHPFPTASSLARSNPSSSTTEVTTTGGGGDYCCSFPVPSAKRRWHPQLPVQVLARLVVSHELIAPNARSRSLGARARLAICITLAPTISR